MERVARLDGRGRLLFWAHDSHDELFTPPPLPPPSLSSQLLPSSTRLKRRGGRAGEEKKRAAVLEKKSDVLQQTFFLEITNCLHHLGKLAAYEVVVMSHILLSARLVLGMKETNC